MNARRNKEIKAVVTALTVTAALASGFLTIRDADAAPPTKKKSTITVKSNRKSKPVYVKMSGSRRAAESRARGLYADALAQKAADEQSATQAQTATPETTSVAASSATAPQPQAFNPYGNNTQQVAYPGTGSFGPVVSGYGPNVGVSGFSIGNVYGSSYPGGGFGYPNNLTGSSGYPSNLTGSVGYPGNFNNGGFGSGTGYPYGF